MDWNIAVILLGLIPIFIGLKKTPVSGWLKSESPDRLYFGPPITERVLEVIGALAAAAPSIMYLRPAVHLSPWIAWFVFVPLIVLLSGACLWFAAPREVYINLVHRTCQKGSIWTFFLQKPPCRLTEESTICVYAGRDSGPVVLWIGALKDPKFLLGKANSREEALDFAHKVGTLSHLPVRETTLAAMRTQMSARKRS